MYVISNTFVTNDKFFELIRKISPTYNPVKKQASLDFYLVSEEIFQHVPDNSIIPGYRSDHSGIYLKIKLHENERGRRYWKFNNTLLKYKDYVM